MKKLNLLIISILFVSTGLFGVISGNDTDKAYEGNGDSGQKNVISSNHQIKTLVIVGAGYFLKSHSDFQLFLNKIELSELTGANYLELQDILFAAIANMENARDTYFYLKNLAAATPYNQLVIDQLRNFDYKAFQEEQNLDWEIFASVGRLLSCGNVTGVYDQLFLNTGEILDGLYTLKQNIGKNIFPELSKLWDLNQKYPKSLLFGQYTTMVFYALN